MIPRVLVSIEYDKDHQHDQRLPLIADNTITMSQMYHFFSEISRMENRAHWTTLDDLMQESGTLKKLSKGNFRYEVL